MVNNLGKQLEIPLLTPVRRNEKDNYLESSNRKLPQNDISNLEFSKSPKKDKNDDFDYYGSNNHENSSNHLPKINGNTQSISNIKQVTTNLHMNADIHRKSSLDTLKKGLKQSNGDLSVSFSNHQSITKPNSTLKGKFIRFISFTADNIRIEKQRETSVPRIRPDIDSSRNNLGRDLSTKTLSKLHQFLQSNQKSNLANRSRYAQLAKISFQVKKSQNHLLSFKIRK